VAGFSAGNFLPGTLFIFLDMKFRDSPVSQRNPWEEYFLKFQNQRESAGHSRKACVTSSGLEAAGAKGLGELGGVC
jgi:hypothetical protein